MKQVFISYTTCNKVQTTEIRDYLERQGIACWMGNRDIPGGANYTKEITTAIRECEVFVLILSAEAQKSEYVFRELDFAVKQKKSVIPYLIEEQEITDEFYFLISSTNGIHAYEDAQESRKKLLARVRELAATSQDFEFYMERPRKKSTKKFIVCPKCRSGVLKSSVSFWDQWVENPKLVRGSTYGFVAIAIILVVWLAQIALKKGRPAAVYLIAALYAPYFWILDILGIDSGRMGKIAELVFLFIYGVIILIILWQATYRIAEYVRSKLYHKRYMQGINIQTFRCCRCNKKFRVKIPIRQQDKYYIKDLVKTEKPEFLQKVIDHITF